MKCGICMQCSFYTASRTLQLMEACLMLGVLVLEAEIVSVLAVIIAVMIIENH